MFFFPQCAQTRTSQWTVNKSEGKWTDGVIVGYTVYVIQPMFSLVNFDSRTNDIDMYGSYK